MSAATEDRNGPFDGQAQTDLDRRVLRAAEMAQERQKPMYTYVVDGLIIIGQTKPTSGNYIIVPPTGRAQIVRE